MANSELDKLTDHKVDHLFLLIGENPLPNYVSAHLLLNKGGTPYLVNTTGTNKQAERLRNILQNDLFGSNAAELISLGEYESDGYHIQDVICQVAVNLSPSDKLGLHYTGGTKAMAVHAYRAMLSLKLPDVVFSYLDPRRLEMCIDREDSDRIRIKIKPDDLQVNLAKIFQIHGWAWKDNSEPIYEAEMPIAAKAFADFHTDGNLVKLWRDWCNQVLRQEARDPKDKNKWLKEADLENVSELSLGMLKESQKIDDVLADLGNEEENLSLSIVRDKGFRSLRSVCNWLDGEWLEHYVLQQVKEIADSKLIHESATSFWIKDPNNPKNDKFQFDVAFMRGYQLFAISCTTIDRKPDCKSKLFEAYIRAQQLGGTEARVALVCCVDSKGVNALRTEIVNVLRSEPESTVKNTKLIVWGRDDLIDLSQKISEWIDENERDAK